METTQLFITLISSLSSQAWIQMGKIKNPVSDKIEKNLDGASMSIDMLSMIQEKTKNNLEEYEDKFLQQSLSDLKMNFVFEKNSNLDEGTSPKEEKKAPKKEKKAPKKKAKTTKKKK